MVVIKEVKMNQTISFPKFFDAIPQHFIQYITRITSSSLSIVAKIVEKFDLTVEFLESKTEHQIIFQHMNLSYSITVFNDNNKIIIEFLIGNTSSIDVEPTDNFIFEFIAFANNLHRIDLSHTELN